MKFAKVAVAAVELVQIQNVNICSVSGLTYLCVESHIVDTVSSHR